MDPLARGLTGDSNETEALGLLPYFVVERTTVTKVGRIDIP